MSTAKMLVKRISVRSPERGLIATARYLQSPGARHLIILRPIPPCCKNRCWVCRWHDLHFVIRYSYKQTFCGIFLKRTPLFYNELLLRWRLFWFFFLASIFFMVDGLVTCLLEITSLLIWCWVKTYSKMLNTPYPGIHTISI